MKKDDSGYANGIEMTGDTHSTDFDEFACDQFHGLPDDQRTVGQGRRWWGVFYAEGPFRPLIRDAGASMGFCDSALFRAFHQLSCLWGAFYTEGPFRLLIRAAGAIMGFCDRGPLPCIPSI